MPGIDRATARVIGLIALLLLTGIALRGYLPGEHRHRSDQPTDNPAATVAVVILLAAAVAIITVAIIATLREPRSPRPAGNPLDDRPGGERRRPSWRFLMIVLAAILVWLLIVVLLVRLGVRLDPGHPAAPSTHNAATPTATPAPPSSPPPAPREAGRDVFWPMLITTLAMLVLWAVGIVLALRRRRTAKPQAVHRDSMPAPAQPGPQPLAVAAERGLAAMGDLSREPREAIIACYAAMEDALANAPGVVPQDSDTPSEVLARAVEHHAIHPGTATELVNLFAEARFSPHVMTEEHRETAVRALELVLAELRSMA